MPITSTASTVIFDSPAEFVGRGGWEGRARTYGIWVALLKPTEPPKRGTDAMGGTRSGNPRAAITPFVVGSQFVVGWLFTDCMFCVKRVTVAVSLRFTTAAKSAIRLPQYTRIQLTLYPTKFE